MSDDELEKLAAEMQNMKPSEASRKKGLDVAMAAFDAEFAAEAVQDRPQEKSHRSQGLAGEPRPMSQSTAIGSVMTFGRDTMRKITDLFSFNGKAAMMVGTCAAALFATSLYIPNNRFEDMPPKSAPQAVALDFEAGEDKKTELKELAESPVTEPIAVKPLPDAKPDISPIEPVVSEDAKPSEPAKSVESKEPLTETALSNETETVPSVAKASEVATPSNVVTIERRVVKTPGRTVERVIPPVTKMETRRIRDKDGSFKTVEETVVVQEASTELVMIPPTYDTVRETVMINADGTSEVLSSEPVAAPEGGINSISHLLRPIKTDSARGDTGEGEALFAAPPPPIVESYSADIAADGSIAPMVEATSEASSFDEIVVTGARSGSSRSKRSSREAVAAPAPPPMPVTAPMSEDKAPVRMVERTIPAVTKTETRRVIKTPASTQERVVPAITKDVTVQVLTEHGTYKDVTKTFVIEPARVEYISTPPVYETVTETVVVQEAMTEMVAIDADGNIIRSEPVVKPKPKPTPQSGLLTAGDYDDVLNPDLYKIYLDKMLQGELRGKDLPYVDADQRINIRIVDSLGQPVPLADITLTTSKRNKMFPLRTGADGMAYLYPDFDGLESGTRLKISAKGSKTVRTKLTRKMINKGGDLEIELKTDAQPIEEMDLLLTIDATGSMGDEMRYLQSELKAIVGRVEGANPGIDIRTGLIVYRDVGDAYVVREVPFTGDIEEFRKALGEQTANGGGDTPEAMHTAMQAGLEMDWREDALKVNLLVADAPPHDRHITETWEAGLLSRTRGIHVVPLAASGVDKTAEFLMRSMAQVTGGRFLFLTDDSGIGNAHAEPTVDCYVVTRLDGLVTRVLSSLIKGERVEPEAGEVIRSVGNYRSGTCEIDPQDQITTPLNVNYEK
ncbi:hypothetical protein [Hellea balneolensis]|uniref:hypothetical protein n=1 Tax=Hellea balneolensis TaxID=287478 RepID=UPI0003F8BCD8|nr:hypothetical protein [Hellea balneolensis]